MPRTSRRAFISTAAVTVAVANIPSKTIANDTPAKARVLVVGGPSSHPPSTHEVDAGGRLLKHCLEAKEAPNGIHVDLAIGWPTEADLKDKASTVVFIGDHFPPMKFPDPKAILKELGTMMDRGCGIVCVHYATGLRAEDVAEDGEHPLLHWMGGYFATKCKHHQSVAKLMTSTIEPESNGHAVLNGVKKFRFDDEPYYNNYFGKAGPTKDVTVLATAMVPPEAPKKETVAWAIARKDGGRGVGIVMPHYYRNWKQADMRTLILNAIVWSAKLEVPANGVPATLPHLETFKPVSVEPLTKKK